jgi:hypothetical protein
MSATTLPDGDWIDVCLCITDGAAAEVFAANALLYEYFQLLYQDGSLRKLERCHVMRNALAATNLLKECARAFIMPRHRSRRFSVLAFISPHFDDFTQYQFMYPVSHDNAIGKGSCFAIYAARSISSTKGTDLLRMQLHSVRNSERATESLHSILHLLPESTVDIDGHVMTRVNDAIAIHFNSSIAVDLLYPFISALTDGACNAHISRVELSLVSDRS